MYILRVVLAAAFVAATTATVSHAQATSDMRVSGAPVAAQLAAGVRRSVGTPVPASVPPVPRTDTKQNRALMIVGGAAMLTGAVIGSDAGTLISVGGAVVFLWGLYQFLQ